MRAATVVLILVAPVNLATNIILVYHTPLGFIGAPVAISITYWTAFLLLALTTYLSPTHAQNETWGGVQMLVVLDFRSCRTFLGLAVPGILMVGTEWCVIIVAQSRQTC